MTFYGNRFAQKSIVAYSEKSKGNPWIFVFCDLGGTLTHDTQNRNLMLYTTELQGLAFGTVNN